MGEMVGSSSHQSYSALLDFLNKSYTLARVVQRSRHISCYWTTRRAVFRAGNDSGEFFWDLLVVS